MLVVMWAALLTLGSALIIHARLGHSVFATQRPTPTDFASAIEIAATSLSILGLSDFTARRRDRADHGV